MVAGKLTDNYQKSILTIARKKIQLRFTMTGGDSDKVQP